MEHEITPVTGAHTTKGRPNGVTSLTPHLAVPSAKEAVAFYRDVFGATVGEVTEMGGVVVHAEIGFDSGGLTLGEAVEGHGLVAPDPERGADYSLALYVPDVDKVVAAAETAGATVREPAATFVSGDRYASVVDPFGVRWTLMTRVEDLSPEESARRVAEWARAQG
ncbi:VOC family protein [Nocardiopsis sp. HNM0947]|uniref:VOC family protein n=1 Tax=Nocardiopsis coralli TaxID=2772213 RepID=A0ABR9PCD1_9ACTN|nr:VOC family protein [Nocardiopsis coralli]MBE3001497.1 VOC family protein [Nocardiopsis coralli]